MSIYMDVRFYFLLDSIWTVRAQYATVFHIVICTSVTSVTMLGSY